MFEQLAARLPKDIRQEFRFALSNGHWRSGLPITQQQRRTCQQVLFIHESNHDGVMH